MGVHILPLANVGFCVSMLSVDSRWCAKCPHETPMYVH